MAGHTFRRDARRDVLEVVQPYPPRSRDLIGYLQFGTRPDMRDKNEVSRRVI